MSCETLRDKDGNFVGIICGVRREKKQFCACGKQCVALCDWKVSTHNSGTCDEPICASHRLSVAPNKDLCPAHQQAYEEWKKRHPVPQGELFSEKTA